MNYFFHFCAYKVMTIVELISIFIIYLLLVLKS